MEPEPPPKKPFQFTLSELLRGVLVAAGFAALCPHLPETNPLLGPTLLILYWETMSTPGWFLVVLLAPGLLTFVVKPSRTTALISGGALVVWVGLYFLIIEVAKGV